jgi:1,2-diacylglycerol 3-alpha-glucosyltransferase
MRVGVVTKWFNRGQPVVGRHLRSALDDLGHETFVLARPKKEFGPRPGALDRDDVWDQPGITEASSFDVPAREYERWVADNGIQAILCDQNYQFDEIASLRRAGVRTIGRFVWEHFTPEHATPARAAFDVIYSLTRSEQGRYATLGIESPYVQWGCHPELLAVAESMERRDDGTVTFVFPGGFLGRRKPLDSVLEAFGRVADERARLLVTAQVERKHVRPALEAAERDRRIAVDVADLATADHLRRFGRCDVCLGLARWEGLGLPLYEAIAFGMPVITNDAPPMNEPIHGGINGLLVASHPDGTARSGIPAVTPDIAALAAAIERLCDDGARAKLAAGAGEVRDTERRWEQTVEGIGALVEGRVPSGPESLASSSAGPRLNQSDLAGRPPPQNG